MKQLFTLAVAVFITVAVLAPATASANDLCEDASGPLTVGSITAGSTTGATFDNAGFCGTSNDTAGVWYTVTGTGNTMTASTCIGGGGANYDTKISVYCPDCEVNECIDGNDDDPACGINFQATTSWPTQAGASYNVLVHGFGGATGDFNLAILDDGVAYEGPLNDCDGISASSDFCPGTLIPESAPTDGFHSNGSALTAPGGVFETAGPNPQGVVYTTEDTAGCSCEQIVDLLDLGQGHLKHGCSFSAMDEWLAEADTFNFCGDCVEAHGTPGCGNGDCEATICSIDPFCCDVAWDGICVAEALDICVPDICTVLAAPAVEQLSIEGGRVGALISEPISKE